MPSRRRSRLPILVNHSQNEDPPNAQQAQHRPKPWSDECVASVHPESTVRRRWLSLLVISITGDDQPSVHWPQHLVQLRDAAGATAEHYDYPKKLNAKKEHLTVRYWCYTALESTTREGVQIATSRECAITTGRERAAGELCTGTEKQ